MYVYEGGDGDDDDDGYYVCTVYCVPSICVNCVQVKFYGQCLKASPRILQPKRERVKALNRKPFLQEQKLMRVCVTALGASIMS